MLPLALRAFTRRARPPPRRAFAIAASKPDVPLDAVVEVKEPRELDFIVPRSHAQAIVFDFYADWCGPCKTLTPTLERAVRAKWPKVALVKLNADAPALAPVMEQLRISSLPTVMGMARGRFVDQFRGAIPEADVIKFVDALVKDLEAGAGESEGEKAGDGEDVEGSTRAATDVLFAGTVTAVDAATRERLAATLSGVINSEAGPELKCRAFAASAMLAIRSEPMDVAGARDLLSHGRALVKGFAAPKELDVAEARVTIAEEIAMISGVNDVDARRAAHDAAPKDFEALRAYALALFARGDLPGACDVALRAVKPSFGSNRDEGKNLVVKLIGACANGDPLAEATRRKLSSLFFL